MASTRGAAGESSEIDGVQVLNANGNPGHLATLGEFAEKGDLRVPVRRIYPIADAAKGLEDFTNEHTVGKLVITM